MQLLCLALYFAIYSIPEISYNHWLLAEVAQVDLPNALALSAVLLQIDEVADMYAFIAANLGANWQQ